MWFKNNKRDCDKTEEVLKCFIKNVNIQRGEMERVGISLICEMIEEINKRIKIRKNEKEVQVINEIVGNMISPYSYSENFTKLKKKEKKRKYG